MAACPPFFFNVLHLGSSSSCQFYCDEVTTITASNTFSVDTKSVVQFMCVDRCGQHYNNGNMDMILFMPVQNKIAF